MLRVIPYPPPPLVNGNGSDNNHRPINLFHNSPLHPHHYNHQQQQQRMAQAKQKQQQQRQQQQQHQQPKIQLPTPSEISLTYKSCTSLFLTRRLPQALALLQTILLHVSSPKVACSRPLRIKVWSLYFAILDAAAKMGSEEGKVVFGSMQEWKGVVGKVRNGSVWDECLKVFADERVRMDGDLIIALTMLILTHSHDYLDIQKKVEAYMSASDGLMSPEVDTDPKLLAQRIKLVELYVLHILPKVEQWDYAKEFTTCSNDLDDDQKEQFVSVLEALFEEKKIAEEHARQLERQRELDLELEREEIERRIRPVRRETDRDRSPSVAGSIRSTHSRSSRRRRRSPESTASIRGSSRLGVGVGVGAGVRGHPVTAAPKQNQDVNVEKDKAVTKRALSNSATNSVFAMTSTMFNRLQASLFNSNGPLAGGKNTSLLLRTVIMVFAVVWAGSKKKVRERLKRLLVEVWKRVVRTIGMGVRVTYI